MIRRYRTISAAVAFAALALASVGGTGVASAEPPIPSFTTGAVRISPDLQRQSDLVARQLSIADTRRDVASFVADAAADAIIIYVAPAKMPRVKRSLSALADTSRLVFRTAQVDQGDVRAVAKNLSPDGVKNDYGVSHIGLANDAKSVVVTLVADSATLRASRAEALARSTGVPVTIRYTRSHVRVFAGEGGRGGDLSPYFGASQIGYRANGEWNQSCSTGAFGTLKSTGEGVMVTARHCGVLTPGSTWYSGANRLIGQNVQGALSSDVTYIRAADGFNFSHRIYTGSAWSTTSRAVKDGVDPGAANSTVFVSGGLRGQATLRMISSSPELTYIPDLQIFANMYWARTENGLRTTGHGDSGSPIYTVHSNGENAVIRGILSGGPDEGGCDQGPSKYKGGPCGSEMAFVGAEDTQRLLNIDF